MKRTIIKQDNLKWLFLVLPISLLWSITGFAQHTVTGTVNDANTNEPLPGATITVEGTELGTTTDLDGNFQITVSTGEEILVVGYIGYERQLTPIEGRTEINIQLMPGVFLSDELVVTGYGVQRKDEITGSVSVVDISEIVDIPTSSPLRTLQGRVPGLFVETSGDPAGRHRNVIIRGLNTLGDNNPLYVIDGVPTRHSEQMMALDPNQIESIQVLKDASAASIYGSRASNGVIIVTTKEGVGGFTVDFTSTLTTQEHVRRVDVLNTEDYGRALWQASINDGTSPDAHSARYSYEWHTDANGRAVLDRVIPVEWIAGDPASRMRSADTDWQDVFYRRGLITSNNLTVSGSTEQTSVMLSMGHLYNQGVIRYNDFQKITPRLNTSFNLLDGVLRLGQNLSMSLTSETPRTGDHNGPGISNWHSGTLINNAAYLQPILPVYTEDGDWSGPLGAGYSDRNNPLHMMWIHQDNSKDDATIFGNAYAELEPLDNLVIRTSLGVDYINAYWRAIEKTYQTGFLGRSINYLEKRQIHDLTWVSSTTANYQFNVNEHNVVLLGGMEALKRDLQREDMYKEGFADESLEYFQFGAGTGSQVISGNRTGHQLLSYFGKINYSWADRYLLSTTIRLDGSSRFGEDNRFGFFPAASIGWRISHEPFMENVGFIDNLLLRVGVGRVGNQEIGDEARFGLYETHYGRMLGRRNYGTAYDLFGVGGGNLPSGYVQTQQGNPALRWESTDEINLGFDYSLLEGRIHGSFEYFIRETSDILTQPPYPWVVGEGGNQWVNGATMENKGIEFVAGYRNNIGEVGFDIVGSISTFRDKITHLPETVVGFYPGDGEQTIIGRSVTSIFGYIADGIFQNQEEVDAHAAQTGKDIGRIRFRDVNGDGQITPADRTWLGHSLPDFIYGLNTQLSYRNWNFSLFVQGVQGVMVHDSQRAAGDFAFGQGMNFGSRVLDAWTPDNPNSTIPMLSLVNTNDETRLSTYLRVDGSYLKFRNASLGYILPTTLSQRVNIQRARIFINAENFLLISPRGERDYVGPDPEVPGSLYPQPVTLSLGVNISI